METVFGWFLAGFGFSVGVLTGAVLNNMATRRGRSEISGANKALLDLLARKCEGIERVAFAAEILAKIEVPDNASFSRGPSGPSAGSES